MSYELTKSQYCKGVQCPKMLWMDKNKPEQAVGQASQAVFETGTKVGELARQYFGEFVEVEFSYVKDEMINQTAIYIEAGNENIAEASFGYDGLFCAIDVLHKNGDAWDIVEVKSSTDVSDIYIDDMAFQYYVLIKCGVPIHSVYNMHINNEYVRNGELNIKELFILEDCTEEVFQRLSQIEDNLRAIKELVTQKEEPQRDIDVYCEKPYECVYKKYCGRHVPERSVFDLARMQAKKKYALYHEGIITYEDILNNPEKVNAKQLRQVDTIYNNKPDEYKIDEIKEFLDTLSYPIYHLDFETFQLAIPEFDGSHPYEQIPFQYSLHIEAEDGSLEHKEFLAISGKDPRRELAERLVSDIPKDVCVTAYNMSFEKTVIKHLATLYDDLSEHLMNLHDNMHDLMVPFQQQSYYSAAMQGSYSIKYVLPALWPGDPELDYHNLEDIHNGSEASAAYVNLEKMTEDEVFRIRKNLLKYCGLDTYAMVKVLRKLKEVAGQ